MYFIHDEKKIENDYCLGGLFLRNYPIFINPNGAAPEEVS